MGPEQKLGMMAKLQKDVVDSQSNKIYERKAASEQAKIGAQTKSDLVKEEQKQNNEVKKLALPGMDKGSSFGDLILPLLGLVSGAVIGGPAGAMAGLSGGTMKSMDMKNSSTQDDLNRQLQRDQLSSQEAHNNALEVIQMDQENRLRQQMDNEVQSEKNTLDLLKKFMPKLFVGTQNPTTPQTLNLDD